MNAGAKIRVELLREIVGLSDSEIADIIRTVIEFYEDAVLPERTAENIKPKLDIINAIKRSSDALDRYDMKRQLSYGHTQVENPDLHRFREVFDPWYRATFGLPYDYTKRDKVKLIELMDKVKEQMETNGLDVNEDTILSSTMVFLQCTHALNDLWINSNFSISVITSMFSRIYTKIKQQNNAKQNSTISDQYKINAIREFTSSN